MRNPPHALALATLLCSGVISTASADTFATIELTPVRGFTLSSPRIEGAPERASIYGSVCRSNAAGRRPRFVRIESIGADGEEIQSWTTPIRGAPGYRGGCGFYAAHNVSRDVGSITRVSALFNR
jgi:hypothetical protein